MYYFTKWYQGNVSFLNIVNIYFYFLGEENNGIYNPSACWLSSYFTPFFKLRRLWALKRKMRINCGVWIKASRTSRWGSSFLWGEEETQSYAPPRCNCLDQIKLKWECQSHFFRFQVQPKARKHGKFSKASQALRLKLHHGHSLVVHCL